MTARSMTMDQFRQSEMIFQPMDICASRHGGNAESRLAFKKAQHGRTRNCMRILEAIKEAGEEGLTAKEYAATSGQALNAISGRFSDLKKDKLIIKTGERRDGSAVCVARN